MVRTNPLTVIVAVAAAVLFVNNVNAQCGNSDCGGCNAGSSGFSYPGGTCGECGGQCGSANHNLHAHIDNLKIENHRAIGRNRAWPMPFQCADRQMYFSIWDPMLSAGIAANCLFSDYHFDSKTGELNNAGRARLRTIVQNMPVGQKSILIQDTGLPEVNNDRLTHLQEVVQQWYGRENFNEIAVTNRYPIPGSGPRFEAINQLYNDGTPVPVIPVATGTGSTSDVGQ
jgi:hypothetical protein